MAAYAGKKPAVNELIELLRVQEGLAGGHFTGVCTYHDGKLHMAKICGDVEDLLRKTNVLDLPGTIGIAHSRTPGYPDDTWSQPFFSSDESTVFCANGVGAQDVLPFEEDTFLRAEQILKAAKLTLTTGVTEELPYPKLSDGKYYHTSEIEAGILAEFHKRGPNLSSALKKTFAFMPSQIAALAMTLDDPFSITFLRYNQALFYGKKEEESLCIATSCTAFQDLNYNYFQAIPAGTVGKMTAKGISFEPLDCHYDKLVTAPDSAAASRYFDTLLAGGKALGLLDMFDAMITNDDISPKGRSPQDSFLLYSYLAEKCRRGEVERSFRMVPGSRPGSLRKETTFRKK